MNLYWLFDDEQREALLKLSIEDFGGMRAGHALTVARV